MYYKIPITIVLFIFFLCSIPLASAQVVQKIGDNNYTIKPSTVLELESTNKALLLTRVANTAAIATPVNGMMIYDISANCVKSYENGVWSACLSTAPAAAVEVDCTASLLNGSYRQNTANVAGNTFTVIYKNNSFTAASFNNAVGDVVLSGASAGLTVSAVSPASTSLASGATATVTYTIAGTPTAGIDAVLTAKFAKFGLTCSKTATIAGNATSGGSANITINNCTTTFAGNMLVGEAVSGVTQTVAVTVGAIGSYSISATANGVTFAGTGSFTTTAAGQTIVLTATGTPIAGGTSTSFNLNTTPSCSFPRNTSWLTLSSISPYMVMSTYDNDYLPYTAPAPGVAATLETPVAADGTPDALLDIQGVITTTGITIPIKYTVVGASVTLTAVSKDITIPAGSSQDGISSVLNFSYNTANLAAGSGIINATLKAVGSVFNAKKLDVQTGIGSDNLGVLLGEFPYFVNGSSGTTATFAVRDMASMCGAFVSPGVYKAFMCHNLGADTSLDPNVAVQGIHGNYYQWGRSTVVADASTPSGAIGGWNTANAADYAWAAVTSGAKVIANDPCPSGFRVPTKAEWDGVLKTTAPVNNTVSYTGTWTNIDTNFGSAIHFGPSTTSYTLTLPAAGIRLTSDGTLSNRGSGGDYWSSTEVVGSTSANSLNFSSGSVSSNANSRRYGFSLRCVSE